jgi:benzoate-CoA ligase family protein
VPTNTALSPEEYRTCLDDSRARVLVVSADLLPRLSQILPVPPTQSGAGNDRPYLKHVIVAGREHGDGANWEQQLQAERPALEPAPTKEDDAAFWLWTSGSTGRPKAAVHLHQDWRHCCEGYAQGVLGMTAGDVTFSAAKLFHAYGLGNGLMFPFFVGATTVLHPGRATVDSVREIVARERPSLFFSVPTFYAAMLRDAAGSAERSHAHDFSSVRAAVSAAEPLPADVFTRFSRTFGVEILDGLGSTEVLHIYLSARQGRVKAGSVGQPVPGYEIRVVDAEGRTAPDGEIGDLLVRGHSTAASYWSRRRATTERMRGEWFHTGDKGYRDGDGCFWYAGRADDMFRVAGEWVSPIELEQALAGHDAVLEAAAVPYQDEQNMTKAMAFVVVKPGVTPSDDLGRELQALMRERLTHYKCPRRIVFVDQLPKTAAGKLQRFRLR